MKNEKISLDKLKEMKEVLENKNTLLMNPIMPTILGYSIKEISIANSIFMRKH